MVKRKLRVKKTVVRSLTKKQVDAARAGWAGFSSAESADPGPSCPCVVESVTCDATCGAVCHTNAGPNCVKPAF